MSVRHAVNCMTGFKTKQFLLKLSSHLVLFLALIAFQIKCPVQPLSQFHAKLHLSDIWMIFYQNFTNDAP